MCDTECTVHGVQCTLYILRLMQLRVSYTTLNVNRVEAHKTHEYRWENKFAQKCYVNHKLMRPEKKMQSPIVDFKGQTDWHARATKENGKKRN